MSIGSVDGLITGMSTSDIINQLMQIEAQGQTRIKTRITSTQKAVTALQSVNTKLSTLGNTADALTKYGAFDLTAATVSSDAVTASTSTGALSGSLTFGVKNLAAAEQHASDGSYALTDYVASGPITITKGGKASAPITPTDGKLESVIAAINSADAGVRASAVQVSTGQYKLQLTSTTTGEASDFSISGLTVATSELVAGTDAKIHIGPDGGGYDVKSATNTFVGVMPGVTIKANKVQEAVTVDVKTDSAGIAKKVEDMVKALNAAVSEIKTQTAYNASDRTKNGPLYGESLMRDLVTQLTSATGRSVGGTTMSDIGLSTGRDGVVSFDQAKFIKAFEADPGKVAQMLGVNSTFTGTGVKVDMIGHRTVEGTYDVAITQAASQATATYDIASVTDGTTYSITSNGKTASYTAVNGDGVDQVLAGLRNAAGTQGLGVAIAKDASKIVVTASNYGSADTLSLAAAAGATVSSTAGTDVAGTIGGLAAKGTGRTLSTGGMTGAAGEISVTVSLTAAQVAGGAGNGQLTIAAGFAQRVESIAKNASDRSDGKVTAIIDRRNSEIKGFNDQVSAWDVRLNLKRNALKRMYGNLEVTLGKLKNQGNWLAGQIAGLG